MNQLSSRTLICGTVIVLAPIIHNIITMAMIAHLLAIDPKGDFHINGMLDHSYQGWCLFIGICLFVVGIISGFKFRQSAENRPVERLSPVLVNG